jgi:hypothetical protein
MIREPHALLALMVSTAFSTCKRLITILGPTGERRPSMRPARGRAVVAEAEGRAETC